MQSSLDFAQIVVYGMGYIQYVHTYVLRCIPYGSVVQHMWSYMTVWNTVGE